MAKSLEGLGNERIRPTDTLQQEGIALNRNYIAFEKQAKDEIIPFHVDSGTPTHSGLAVWVAMEDVKHRYERKTEFKPINNLSSECSCIQIERAASKLRYYTIKTPCDATDTASTIAFSSPKQPPPLLIYPLLSSSHSSPAENPHTISPLYS